MDENRNPNPIFETSNFEFHDFAHDPNFDQFIDLIRGENDDLITGFDCDFINSCFAEENHIGPTVENIDDTKAFLPDPYFVFDESLPNFGDENLKLDLDAEQSSGGTMNTGTTGNGNRGRTLISERKRRSRMKETLYSLRSIVPNITKMDKASIVGDAVSYIQELQNQAKQIKSEISSLESSLIGPERYHESFENTNKIQVAAQNYPKKIIQMEVFQVEDRAFYVRLICNKGEGVAASLYTALESFTTFHVQNSTLATASDRFVLTFTLTEKDRKRSLNLPNLKIWISGALLNQGFEFITPLLST